MTDTELRDSIAKEIFISISLEVLKTENESITAEGVAAIAFNSADIFMNEKLKRQNNLQRDYLGKN
ncbi:MAG: hypothetical protein V4493_01155 [Pseudomonadota bacterium]